MELAFDLDEKIEFSFKHVKLMKYKQMRGEQPRASRGKVLKTSRIRRSSLGTFKEETGACSWGQVFLWLNNREMIWQRRLRGRGQRGIRKTQRCVQVDKISGWKQPPTTLLL